MMRRAVLCVLLLLLAGACNSKEKYQNMVSTGGGDADRGKKLIQKYGCDACHVIPGVSGPKGMVGPPLDHIATRQIIAGKYTNDPKTMMQWIQNPQALSPDTSMPNMNVTPADARDITAYLYTLK